MFQGNTPFLSSVPPSETIFLSLCDMVILCLQVTAQGSPFSMSFISPNVSTVSSLPLRSNYYYYECIQLYSVNILKKNKTAAVYYMFYRKPGYLQT